MAGAPIFEEFLNVHHQKRWEVRVEEKPSDAEETAEDHQRK